MAVSRADTQIGADVFGRVLAGVDGSQAGRDAAVQAARLVTPEGALELVTAVYLIDARLQGWPERQVAAALELEGGPVVYEAAALAGPRATTRLVSGPPLQSLLEEAVRYKATLIAVGTHGYSRLSEKLIGGVSGPLLQAAPCSVLIARPPKTNGSFPFAVVVGIDGSPGSLAALAAGEYLSDRFAVPLRAVLARRGDVDLARAERRAPQLEVVDARPVDALVEAAETTDLLLVGSRGRHGLSALGSVSERVAHDARSSVLVVRSHSHADA